MACLMALLVSQAASPAKADPYLFDAINVTASESETRPDLDPDSMNNLHRVESTARFGTEVITRQQIRDYAPKDIFDLLGKAAGINMTYQGRKSPFFLDDRGGGQLTYILDGAVLPQSANRILMKLPLSDIEEIQVVRGSTTLSLGPTIPVGSGNTGSGLNTGFVIIRTKHPQKTEGEVVSWAEKSLSLPTANGQTVYAGTKLGKQDAFTSGYLAAGLSRYDRPSNDTWFDAQNGQSLLLNGGVGVGKLTVDAMVYTDKGSFQMQRGVTLQGTLDTSKWYYDPLYTTLFSTNAAMNWSKDQVTLFSAFSTHYDQTERDESFASSAAANARVAPKYYTETSSGYSLKHNARFGSTFMQLSGQWTTSNGFGPNLSSAYNNFDTSVRGWSVLAEQKLFKDRVGIDIGFRQDSKHIDVSSTSAATNKVNTNVDMPAANTVASGITWKASDRVALNGRYFLGGEGTNGDFALRTQSGLPLHAERQQRVELSVETKPADYCMPMVTWFDYRIWNQKAATTSTYVVDGETYYYYTETDARRTGFELAVKGNLSSRSNYSLSWTHLVRDTTTSGGVTSEGIGVSYPENLCTFAVSQVWGPYRMNLSVKQVGSWQTTTSPLGTLYADLGDYTSIDAGISRDFRFSGWKLTAMVYGRNLGNEKYATKYVTGYYPDRGRTFGASLSMAF